MPGQLWPPVVGVDPVGVDVLGAVDPVDPDPPEVPELPVEAELDEPEVPVAELPEPDVVDPELVFVALWLIDGELAA
jgi:hypothetical protein